ncbi:MAG: prolipoprotein diacylglyceryl transferase family protein [Acidobacteriaceae bacterium]
MKMAPHPAMHFVFETLGYVLGYALYKWERRRRGDFLGAEQRWEVIAVAAVGALAGSRLLGLLEDVPLHAWRWSMVFASGGKTIVGGLLGGWIGVELMKRARGIQSRTGDLFAVPLCVGIAVGRVGCFVAGLADDTYGKPTRLPWGVDFGDGVPRHPTQLYEIAFLAALAVGLHWYQRRPHPEGAVFRIFLMAYLGWRLAIDFLKPQPLVLGMNMIQWACLVGLVALVPDVMAIARGVSHGHEAPKEVEGAV